MTKSEFIKKLSENTTELMEKVYSLYLEDPDVKITEVLRIIMDINNETVLFISNIDEQAGCIKGKIEIPEFMNKKRA